MPESRHDWPTEWERHPRTGPQFSWRRVLRGADATGSIEYLAVRAANRNEAGRWVWVHRGPDRDDDRRHRLHAVSAGYGTTAAAKRAADRYFTQLLADERAAAACGTAGHPAWPHDCAVTERVHRRYGT